MATISPRQSAIATSFPPDEAHKKEVDVNTAATMLAVLSGAARDRTAAAAANNNNSNNNNSRTSTTSTTSSSSNGHSNLAALYAVNAAVRGAIAMSERSGMPEVVRQHFVNKKLLPLSAHASMQLALEVPREQFLAPLTVQAKKQQQHQDTNAVKRERNTSGETNPETEHHVPSALCTSDAFISDAFAHGRRLARPAALDRARGTNNNNNNNNGDGSGGSGGGAAGNNLINSAAKLSSDASTVSVLGVGSGGSPAVVVPRDDVPPPPLAADRIHASSSSQDVVIVDVKEEPQSRPQNEKPVAPPQSIHPFFQKKAPPPPVSTAPPAPPQPRAPPQQQLQPLPAPAPAPAPAPPFGAQPQQKKLAGPSTLPPPPPPAAPMLQQHHAPPPQHPTPFSNNKQMAAAAPPPPPPPPPLRPQQQQPPPQPPQQQQQQQQQQPPPPGFQSAKQQLVSDAQTRGGAAAAAANQLRATPTHGGGGGIAGLSGSVRKGLSRQNFIPPLARNKNDGNADDAQQQQGGGAINQILGSVGGNNNVPVGGGGGGGNKKSSKKQKNHNNSDDDSDDESNFPASLLNDDGTIPKALEKLEPKLVHRIANEMLSDKPNVSWDHIAGLEHAKKAVEEAVVWPLMCPEMFVGIREPPRGLLLFGPPGTGKSLTAKAIASQAQSSFFAISSSMLMSKWIGEGEKLVRCLFAVAQVKQPSVVFIDEIDSLLTARTEGEQDAVRRMKTEFLIHLDGVATNGTDRVLIVGATNRPEELDEAARRRMEKRLYIPLPDAAARRQMLKINLFQNTDLVKAEISDSELDEIAARCDGYSGADMKSVCKTAAMSPTREIIGKVMPLFREGKIDDAERQRMMREDCRPILARDVFDALQNVKPSVGAKELTRYEKWNRDFGSFQF